MGGCIALEADAAHVGALARLNVHGDRHGAIIMGAGCGLHVGKAVALAPKPAGDQVGGHGHAFLGKELALLQHHQLAQLLLVHDQVAVERDLTHLELFTLIHRQGHEHLFLVLGQRDIGRLDTELDITAVQVMGAQALKVSGKLLARVLVRVGNGVPPAGFAQLHQADQLFLGERLVTNDVDVLDGGDLALIDAEVDGNAVARQLFNLGIHIRVIAALGDVGTQNLELKTLQRGALEDLAFLYPGLAHAFHELFGLDVLVALNLNPGNRGPLLNGNDEDIAFTGQTDIGEKSGLEKIPDGVGSGDIIHLITDLDRQGTEDVARRHPLKTFHLNVRDPEGLG